MYQIQYQWQEIQANTYIEWVNHHLSSKDITVNDLKSDFSDGVNLVLLLEVLSEKPVGRYIKNPRFPGQKIDNIQTAIRFMEKTWGIKVVGLSPKDIMEGNIKQIMGLIFLLVNKVTKSNLRTINDELKGPSNSSIRLSRANRSNSDSSTVWQKMKVMSHSPTSKTDMDTDDSLSYEEDVPTITKENVADVIVLDSKPDNNGEQSNDISKSAQSEEKLNDISKSTQSEEKLNDKISVLNETHVNTQNQNNPQSLIDEELKKIHLEKPKENIPVESVESIESLMNELKDKDVIKNFEKVHTTKKDKRRSKRNSKGSTIPIERGDSKESILTKSRSEKIKTPKKSKSSRSNVVREPDSSTEKNFIKTSKEAIIKMKHSRAKSFFFDDQQEPKSTRPRSHSTISSVIAEQIKLKKSKSKRGLSIDNTYVLRMQACIRGKMARLEFKKILDSKCKFYSKKIEENSETRKQIERLQAVIKSKITRFTPPMQLKRLRRRLIIASEVLGTEESYVHGLYCLTEIYLKNLKSLPQNILDPDKVKTIFNNSEIIYKYNKIILDKLRVRMKNWYKEEMRLGDIFLKMADFLKVYTAYVNGYNKALITLTELSKEPEIAESLRKSREDPETKAHDLQSYLITPIQRLPRYVMLLQDLLSQTENKHPDFVELSTAVQKMASVADYVNEKKREAENLNAVLQITGHIIGYPGGNLAEVASRTYVRQGPLATLENVDISHLDAETLSPKLLKQRYLFLFNDMFISTKKTENLVDKIISGLKKEKDVGEKEENDIIYTLDEIISSEVTFKYCNDVNFDGMELVDFLDTEDKHYMALKNCETERVWNVISAPDPKSKLDFLIDLDDCIWNRLKAWRSHYEISKEDEEKASLNANQAAMCGNLHKQARSGEWKKKYCELIGSQFKWYKKPEDKVMKRPPSRTVSTLNSNITLIPVMDRPNCFMIGTNRGAFYFSAETGPKRMQWVNALRRSIRVYLKELQSDESTSVKALHSPNIPKLEQRIPKSSPSASPVDGRRGSISLIFKSPSRSPFTKSKPSQSKLKLIDNSTKILYKENKHEKFKKYTVEFKDRNLNFTSNKVTTSFDLLLAQPIEDNIVEIRTKVGTLYSVYLVCDNRKDRIASDNKEELSKWITNFNQTIKDLKKMGKKS